MPDVFASIDLGGTKLHAAFATGSGEILAELKDPTRSHEGPAAVVDRMGSMIERLREQTGHRPAAVGIGVPGLADVEEGVVRFLPNLPTKWRGVPVAEPLAPRLGCPVRVLNDARTATLGELAFGHGREVADFAFFTLGTGVGGGLVLDGKLRLGPLGAAGELGHQTIDPHGLPCGCGSRGCLETIASGPALTAEGVRLVLSGNAPRLLALCEGDLNRIHPGTMAEAARAGEESVRAAIERAAIALGIAAANVVTIAHPSLIVLGGGVAGLGDLLTTPVATTIRERVGMFPTDDVRVLVSPLGERAGLLGGIALAAGHGFSR